MEIAVNGRRMTNIGTFRAYVYQYLRHHPKIHQDLTLLVRQRPPTEHGIPIEIYAFTNDIVWANYENIQADIFDHILAVLHEFDLRVYQQPSGLDLKSGIDTLAARQLPSPQHAVLEHPRDLGHPWTRTVEAPADRAGRARRGLCSPAGPPVRYIGNRSEMVKARTQLAGEQGKEVSIHLYGQEVNPETYAISKADLILKGEGGEAEHMRFGSTLSADAFPAYEFDFMLSNPPCGKSWKTDMDRMGGRGGITDTRFVVPWSPAPATAR